MARVVALAALAAVLVLAPTPPAQAQHQQPSAAAPFPQLELTVDHIARYIAVSRELLALASRLKAAGTSGAAIIEAQEAARDAISRKHGLESGTAHQQVDYNIWLVIAGMDRKTSTYADPIGPLNQQIAAIEADKSLAEPERQQSLALLKDELAALQPLQFRSNIELVRSYFREIDGVRLAQFMLAIEQ